MPRAWRRRHQPGWGTQDSPSLPSSEAGTCSWHGHGPLVPTLPSHHTRGPRQRHTTGTPPHPPQAPQRCLRPKALHPLLRLVGKVEKKILMIITKS